MPAPFEEDSSCVLSQTKPASGELRAALATFVADFKTAKREFCKCSNYFKSRKMKRILKSFRQSV